MKAIELLRQVRDRLKQSFMRNGFEGAEVWDFYFSRDFQREVDTAVTSTAKSESLALLPEVGWNDCDDCEMPKCYAQVLVYCPEEDEPILLGYNDGVDWMSLDQIVIKPSHWMPLPESPKEMGINEH